MKKVFKIYNSVDKDLNFENKFMLAELLLSIIAKISPGFTPTYFSGDKNNSLPIFVPMP